MEEDYKYIYYKSQQHFTVPNMGTRKAGISYRVSYTAKIMLKMSTFYSIEVKRLKHGGWNLGHVLCKLCLEK